MNLSEKLDYVIELLEDRSEADDSPDVEQHSELYDRISKMQLHLERLDKIVEKCNQRFSQVSSDTVSYRADDVRARASIHERITELFQEFRGLEAKFKSTPPGIESGGVTECKRQLGDLRQMLEVEHGRSKRLAALESSPSCAKAHERLTGLVERIVKLEQGPTYAKRFDEIEQIVHELASKLDVPAPASDEGSCSEIDNVPEEMSRIWEKLEELSSSMARHGDHSSIHADILVRLNALSLRVERLEPKTLTMSFTAHDIKTRP